MGTFGGLEVAPTEIEVLTQIGSVGGFRSKPRQDKGEKALSLLLGEHPPEKATQLAFQRPARNRDAVRYASAWSLRREGFLLWPDPLPLNPHHILVYFLRGEWDDAVALRFNRCFGEPIRGEKPVEGEE